MNEQERNKGEQSSPKGRGQPQKMRLQQKRMGNGLMVFLFVCETKRERYIIVVRVGAW